MTFYDEIARMGVQDILNHAIYKNPNYIGWAEVQHFLSDLVHSYATGEEKRVLIYGDYDVDGLICALTMRDGLSHLGVKNLDVYHYTERTHNLDTRAAQKAIWGRYDYFIVCDTGSSNKELLQRVAQHGTRVILLDHHVTVHEYDDFGDGVAIINTTIENNLLTKKEFELSAGALCYTVIRKFCEEQGYPLLENLAAYATISLYADCMNMGNYLNRAIYYEAKTVERSHLPSIVQLFMNDYSNFGARYIGFWFSPRINSLFRSENFEILNRLAFDDCDNEETATLCELVEDIYSKIRALTKELADIIEVSNMDHFVIGDLQSVEEFYDIQTYKIYNYTGLVANMLSEKYGKAAVVHCYAGNEIKGSVRDVFSRDYLRVFGHICNAGGHAAAFGFHIGAFDLDTFLNSLRYIDDYFPIEVRNEPIIINVSEIIPDSVFIEDVATYNEFAGQGLPVVYLRKQIIGDLRETRTKYSYKYKWGDYVIQSNYSLNFGTYVLLKPIKSIHTKLLVQ